MKWYRKAAEQGKAFAQNNLGVLFEFVDHGVPRSLSGDVSLCVFRVIQEALRNVIKHSGATTARVELIGTEAELVVRISDTGVGFDPASDQAQQGLGLVSMRERLRAVGGEFSLAHLEPNGTQLDVRVPLPGQTFPLNVPRLEVRV